MPRLISHGGRTIVGSLYEPLIDVLHGRKRRRVVDPTRGIKMVGHVLGLRGRVSLLKVRLVLHRTTPRAGKANLIELRTHMLCRCHAIIMGLVTGLVTAKYADYWL